MKRTFYKSLNNIVILLVLLPLPVISLFIYISDQQVTTLMLSVLSFAFLALYVLVMRRELFIKVVLSSKGISLNKFNKTLLFSTWNSLEIIRIENVRTTPKTCNIVLRAKENFECLDKSNEFKLTLTKANLKKLMFFCSDVSMKSRLQESFDETF